MAISLAAFRSLWPGKQNDGESGGPTGPIADKARDRAVDEGPRVDARVSRSARTYAREAAALMFIASGLYLALALASYEASPLRPEVSGPDWVGPVGAVLANALVHAVGIVAWLAPLELMLVSQPLLTDRKLKFRITRVSGDVLVAVTLAGLIHIAFPRSHTFGEMPLGGLVGELFGSVMRSLFSTVGSYLVGLTVVGLILVERATFSFIESMQQLRHWLLSASASAQRGAGVLATAWKRARAADQERRERECRENEPRILAPEAADDIIAAYAEQPYENERLPRVRLNRPGVGNLSERRPPVTTASLPTQDPLDAETPAPQGPLGETVTPVPDDASTHRDPASKSFVKTGAAMTSGAELDPTAIRPLGAAAHEVLRLHHASGASARGASTEDESTAKRALSRNATGSASEPHADPNKLLEEPLIVDTSQVTKTEKAKRNRAAATSKTGFQLPSTELLDPIVPNLDAPSKEVLHETARLLEKTLADYKIEGKVQEIWPGPTVTMYEVAPAPGTKVSRVASLADDLALALARKVRIVAPIPGKNRIGFEVPNERRVAVSLRELFESKQFMSMDAPLPCVLGRDIIGNPCFGDLSSMPHVIVAGATGAGKSVGLNVMLLSMLYRRTPDELRMLMIDPKVVELAPFDKIPHLLFPVVTDMKQAANALKWTVDEMERRYQLFADAGTRNIGSYNKWVEAVLDGEKPMPPGPKRVEAVAPDGTGCEVMAASDGSDVDPPKKLPFIVVVVDEFADLMMTHGKDVESSVARLAQKARAAGIHVILATQRPSVDVITGMIKANFPSRIAFRVVQRNDSATILDQQGAEHLLGKGDMLVKLNGTTDVKRVQCPFATEDEVQRVTDYLRTQGEPEYDESIVRSRDDDEDSGSTTGNDAESDPLYDAAVRVVAETRRATTSFIQRKLGIGYNRAAKIIETMEQRGVIGPAVGTRPREVLISTM